MTWTHDENSDRVNGRLKTTHETECYIYTLQNTVGLTTITLHVKANCMQIVQGIYKNDRDTVSNMYK